MVSLDQVYFIVDYNNPRASFDALIEKAKTIPATPQRPLFLLTALRNTFDDSVMPVQPNQFSIENLESLLEMVLHPGSAWDAYERNQAVGSELPSKLYAREDDPAEENDIPNSFVVFSIGLFDTNKYDKYRDLFKDTEYKQIVKAIPPYVTYQRHRHGFFNLKFNDKFEWNPDLFPSGLNRGKYEFWAQYIDPEKKEEFTLDLYKSFQLPCHDAIWVEGCEEDERRHLWSIPCVIYAFTQCGVDSSIIDELWAKNVNYGNVIKTKVLNDILRGRKIQLRLYKVSQCNRRGKTLPHITSNDYPTKIPKGEENDWKIVRVCMYKGHMFQYKDYTINRYSKEGIAKEVQLSFLTLVNWAVDRGILVPFNAYEYASWVNVDALIDFDQKLWLKNIKEVPKEKQFKECFRDFKISKWNCPRRVFFADFECTTDQKYHCPFLVCYKGDGEQGHFTGINCGEQFLRHLLDRYWNDIVEEKAYRQPFVRVYFHNLAYDFTFLWPYLTNIKGTFQGEKLYDVTGFYKYKGKRIRIQFADSLKMIPLSLAKAAKTFLEPETLKKIKKEAFPYNFYTYSTFEKYPNGNCPLEDFRQGFTEKQAHLLKQFDENLPNLSSIIYDSEAKTIDLMQYAIFYCDQDVNVLKTVFKRYKKLFLEKPFEEDIMQYRTVTSLAYNWFLKHVIMERRQEEDDYGNPKTIRINGQNMPSIKWLPRHDFYQTAGVLRLIGGMTVRGGRTMVRDNLKQHYIWDGSPESLIQDFDARSLYPSAISVLWLTEGKPYCIQGEFSQEDFLRDFTPPEAEENVFKKYNDGWVHVTYLNVKKDRHFPLLCIKDPKTKLNNYQNFHGPVDTWVNAIDLFNLIDFQDAEFVYDAAIVWEGKRYYDCRKAIKEIYDYRASKPKEDPMNTIAKLIMNSMYGKSALKIRNSEEHIVDAIKWRKMGTETNVSFEKVDNWRNFYNSNAYCIKSIESLDYDQPYVRLLNRKNYRKYKVKLFSRDMSPNFVSFGSNVLAMARRIIGRVMALAEDIEAEHSEWGPQLFYTDTDSMHITNRLLSLLETRYEEKYHKPLIGADMLQFHSDFEHPDVDAKAGDKIIGAVESIFVIKKVYIDKLLVQFHDKQEPEYRYFKRGKGFPAEALSFEQYLDLFNDKPITIDLTDFRVLFYHERGCIGTQATFKRTITSKEFKEKLLLDKEKLKEEAQLLVDLEKVLRNMDPHQRPLENIPPSNDDNDTEILSEDNSDSEDELEIVEPVAKRQKI